MKAWPTSFKVARTHIVLGFGHGSQVEKTVPHHDTTLPIAFKETIEDYPKFLAERRMLGARKPRAWILMSGEGLPKTTILVLPSLRFKKFARICRQESPSWTEKLRPRR